MPYNFNKSSAKLNKAHNRLFSETMSVDGDTFVAIYDETPDNFEGIDALIKTVTVSITELSEKHITINRGDFIYRPDLDETLQVTRKIKDGTDFILTVV